MGRRLPDDVGHQPPDHPHPGRALDDRGALPRARRWWRSSRTTPTTSSSPTSGCPPSRAPTARWRWRWGTCILKEFFVDRQHAVLHRLRQAVHRPALPGQRSTSRRVDGRAASCRASSSPPRTSASTPPRRTPTARPCCRRHDRAAGRCPTARSGLRYAEAGQGRWNLDLGGVDPRSPMPVRERGRSRSSCSRASTTATARRLDHAPRRPRPPGRRPAGHHRLRPDAGPVRRSAATACRGDWPAGYDDATAPYTPAWQEAITGVPAAARGPGRPGVRPQRRGLAAGAR